MKLCVPESSECQVWLSKIGVFTEQFVIYSQPFNAGIKSLRAALPDEMFYWGFCFLNRAFR
jgi:hypothetical protein